MKIKTLIIKAALALLAIVPSAQALPDELSVWAGGGTDVSTTLCYTVVSAYSKNGGTPVLTYLNATSDKAGSIVQFYNSTNSTFATAANGTTTNYVSSTNGFAANDVIVIQHLADDSYERRIISSLAQTNQMILTSATSTATAVGDKIWKMTTQGSIPCGSATLTITGTGIYAGQRSKPLLFEIDGTSACQINAACASYVP